MELPEPFDAKRGGPCIAEFDFIVFCPFHSAGVQKTMSMHGRETTGGD